MRCEGEINSLGAQSVGERVRTSHACSFQDMWKSKSAKRATNRKAGYAPGIV